jgi:hypothetical protein
MPNLDRRVKAVEQLPERVAALESQIVQLRGEMRSEFSAVRQEMRDLFAESERHARVLHEDVITRIAAIHER